jgi:hypothetical protein
MATTEEVKLKSGPTSSVIKEVKEWSDASLLIPHEFIRDGLDRMEYAVLNWGEDAPWKLVAFKKWYNRYFHYTVESHHYTEETIFFPEIVKKSPSIVDTASKQHGPLVTMMDEIRDAKDYASLKEKVPVFVKEMKAHLAEEEEWWPKLMKDHFTQDEHDVLVDKAVGHLGLFGAKIAIPWILHCMDSWAPTEVKEGFWSALPPPLQWMYSCSWIHDFRKNNLGLLASISDNKEMKTWCWV